MSDVTTGKANRRYDRRLWAVSYAVEWLREQSVLGIDRVQYGSVGNMADTGTISALRT